MITNCPETNPFAYYNGDYCCSTEYEKVYSPDGLKCDGGKISLDSLCCKGNAVKCPSRSCVNAGIYSVSVTILFLALV